MKFYQGIYIKLFKDYFLMISSFQIIQNNSSSGDGTKNFLEVNKLLQMVNKIQV